MGAVGTDHRVLHYEYTVWRLCGQTTRYRLLEVRHVEAVLTPCGGDMLDGKYAMWRLYTRHVEAVYVDWNGICVGELLVCVCALWLSFMLLPMYVYMLWLVWMGVCMYRGSQHRE